MKNDRYGRQNRIVRAKEMLKSWEPFFRFLHFFRFWQGGVAACFLINQQA